MRYGCRKQAPTDAATGLGVAQRAQATGEIRDMAEVTIVYWRDIPAQVIVGKGRRGITSIE